MRSDLVRGYLFKVALVAGAYFGTAKFGLTLAYENSSVTAVWPPTGVALAATLIWGYRIWPGVALGALLANTWTGVPPITVLGIASGNTLEAIVGAYLLRRVGFRASLARVKDVLALFALGGIVSTTVSASIGVASLHLGAGLPVEAIVSTWRVWWLGDMGGDLLVAPVLLLAASRPIPVPGPRRILEAAALLAAAAVNGIVIFSQEGPLTYALFPPLIWGALRFRQAGAALSSLIVAGIAVVFTAGGSGPFMLASPDDSLLLSQTFMCTAAVTALLLAAITSQQREAQAKLQTAHEGLEEKVRERTAELERSYESDRRLRAIVEHAGDPIIGATTEGVVTSWNPGAERLYGYTADEMIGHSVSRIIPEHRANEFGEILSTIVLEGRAYRDEAQRRRSDGSLVWVSLTVSPVKDSDGRVVGCSAIHSDITERRRAEEELRKRESQLADAQRSAQIGSWEWNVATNQINWSDELYRIHGLEPGQFEASFEAFIEGVHPDDREFVEGVIKKAFGDGAPFAYEHRCIRPGGEVRMLRAQGQVECDDDGRPLRMSGTCQDVTELKRMEEPLRRFGAIVEASQDAIFSKSRESTVTSWNPGAQRLFGYEPKDIIGRPAHVLIPPDRRSEEREIMARVLSGEGIVNYETERLRKDGARIDVSMTLSPIKDGDGVVIGCASITRDIRLQKRTQEEADRLKDEFFATVSHELRTPLTSIIGYTDLLLAGEGGMLTDQQRRFLEVTERNAKRQLRLVGDMLFVSQAEAGEFSIELGNVDLHRLVAGCVEAARPAADKRGVELVYGGERTPKCEVDADRLAQLVDNLVSNAIKFTPEAGRARVDLTLDGNHVVLEVANTGSYISPAEQGRLFDRFYRTPSANGDAVQGVGLGLTIAEAIVAAHGGTICVESDEQVGTVFRVWLPLREPEKVVDLAERRRGAAA